MAGAILELYKLGYRNFIFFVQSTTIIKKTIDNFLKLNHSKYLFNDSINIEGKNIYINKVSNFSFARSNDLNIIFTTTQGLHSNIKNPSENSLTFESFEDQKIVFIADEAHHINADTKESKKVKESRLTWESTVTKLFNANSENYLLEFTATADLDHPEIKQKYFDKLIFDYPLKNFRNDQYSKEVKLFQADISPIDRALLAIILSQYRLKVFEKNGINIKPVLLFKSKTIQESIDFQKEFVSFISQLESKNFKKALSLISSEVFEKAQQFFKLNNISLENLALEIKEDFSSNKCLSVNSKDDSEEKQIILNNLEDEDNKFRAIFAVDQLNEGWDVLNLFDIVRLYNTRDADHKSGKIGKTTMQEAQLIGRGARYCPFSINDQDLFKRKYDHDLENEMRICEELYYHAAHNPKYISELNKALSKIGIKPNKEVTKILKLKDEFRDSSFFKHGLVFTNNRIAYERNDVECLDEALRKKIFKKSLATGFSAESMAFEENEIIQENNKKRYLVETQHKEFFIKDFGINVIRKSLDQLPFINLVI